MHLGLCSTKLTRLTGPGIPAPDEKYGVFPDYRSIEYHVIGGNRDIRCQVRHAFFYMAVGVAIFLHLATNSNGGEYYFLFKIRLQIV